MEAGTWRNPALSDAAKAKLSQPRQHEGDLHGAIEKLRTGTMADLSDAEAAAYRQYRQTLRDARREALNTAARERYHKQQAAMTDEQRAAQRQKWQQANKRRAKK